MVVFALARVGTQFSVRHTLPMALVVALLDALRATWYEVWRGFITPYGSDGSMFRWIPVASMRMFEGRWPLIADGAARVVIARLFHRSVPIRASI
jgi:hypothetical protein